MAEPVQNGATALHRSSHIPIAQLTPLLSAASSRSIKAVVTLTWPYSSITDSFAFLLAEPDFRLRRTRGQVRVQFTGSSAKVVSKSGIASGDEVILSLEGVEWIHDEATVSTPGRGVEFELRFRERLLLQFCQEEQEKVQTINIDHPPPEPEPEHQNSTPTPEPEPTHAISAEQSSTSQKSAEVFDVEEWSSPAFIKRARTSYGSLFDSDYDPFAEEDGTVRGKGRKRTRLSSSWRYTSRSPTPEAEEEEESEPSSIEVNTSFRASVTMTDEGCQTMDLDVDAAEALADFARQSTNVASSAYVIANGLESGNTNHTLPQHDTQDLERSMPPPLLDVQQPFKAPTYEDLDQGRGTPEPPRLQPVPSESLPLVSPLVTSKFGIFSRPETNNAETGYHLFSQESSGPRANDVLAEVPVIEDLYNASPIGRYREEQQNLEDANDTINPESAYSHGEQYNHWESVNAPNDHHESPLPTSEVLQEHEFEDYHAEEVASSPVNHYLPAQHYPELEDEIPHDAASWEHRPAAVMYPDLPDPDEENSSLPDVSPPRARFSAASRSQSVQSQIINLTESDQEIQDDEEDEEIMENGSVTSSFENHVPGNEYEPRNQPEAGEYYDDSDVQAPYLKGDETEEEDAEELEDDEDAIDKENHNIRRPHHPHNAGPSVGEDEVSEEEEEEQEEDGYDFEEEFEDDADDQQLPTEFAQNSEEEFEGFGDEEDAGSYDEEESEDEEQEARPVVRRQPEVIDLLSSDDEDQGQSVQQIATQAPTRPRSSSPVSQDGSVTDESEVLSDGEDVEQNDASEQGLVNSHLAVDEPFDEEQTSAYDSDGNETVEEEEEEVEQIPTSDREDSDEEKEIPEEAGRLEEDVEQIPTLIGEHEHEEDEKEIAEEEVEQTATLVLQDQQEEDDRPPDLELQDVEDKMDIDEEPSLTQSKESTTSEQVANSSKRILAESSFGPSKISPARPSLFSRMWGGDGANDEPGFSSPTVPTLLSSPPMTQDNNEKIVEEPHVAVEKSLIKQLPTPDNTQESDKVLLSQTSFTSIVSHVSSSDEQQTTFELEPTTETTEVKMTEETNETTTKFGDEQSTRTTYLQQTTIKVEESSELIITKDEDQGIPMELGAPSELKHEQTPEQSSAEPSSLIETEKLVPQDSESTELEGDQTSVISSAEESVELVNVAEEVPTTVDDDAGSVVAKREDPATASSAVDEADVVDEDMPDIMEPITVANHERDNQTDALAPSPIPAKDAFEDTTKEITDETQHGLVSSSLRAVQKATAITGAEEPQQENRNLHVETEEPTVESPRRSSRIAKPKIKKETPIPVTPTKSRSSIEPSSKEKDKMSPMVVLDPHISPKGHDASIELALSSLDSPSKPTHDLRRPPVADLKLRLTRALRTELTDYTSLKVLRYHLKKNLDVLGVVTTASSEPQRAKGGPRHNLVTFNITDSSTAPAGVTQVQVFRPYKEALPIVKVGDGILLRNFQVNSVTGKGFALRSTDEASWAVFKDGDEVEVRGPPVEYKDREKQHLIALRAWYRTLDDAALAKIERANGNKA